MTSGGLKLPHSVQAEESLLGAMLLSAQAVGTASEKLHSGDFYKPAHGHIFEAITGLYAAGQPVDPVTVAEELRRAELLDHIGKHQFSTVIDPFNPDSAIAFCWSHALLSAEKRI